MNLQGSFHALVDELCSNGASNRSDLDVLDDLNRVAYPINDRDWKNGDVSKLVKWIQKYRPEPQALKFCNILFKLYSRQPRKAVNLGESVVVSAFTIFVLDTLKKVSDLEKIDVLRALGTLLFENGPSLQDSLQRQVVDALIPLATHSDTGSTSSGLPAPSASAEIRRTALVCLGHLCVKLGPKAPFYDEIATNALRALQLVLTESSSAVASAVEPLVTLLCMVALATESQSAIQSATTARNPRTVPVTTSDSEMSDSEFGSTRTSKNPGRLEMNALQCLHTAIKQSPKLFHSSWSRLLPDGPETSSAVTLCSIARHHPQSRVRLAVYQVVGALFDGAKQYLSIADVSSANKSFTSLAERLGRQLTGTYFQLLSAIPQEPDMVVLVHLLKALSVLIRNTTFKNLPSDLPLWILSLMYPRAQDGSDTTTQVAALEVITVLVESGFKTSSMDALSKQKTGFSLSCILDLFESESLPARIAAFDCVAAFAKNDIVTMNEFWDEIILKISKNINDENPTLRAASYKVFEQYLQAGSSSSAPDEDDIQVQTSSESTLIPSPRYTQVLNTYVIPGFADASYVVRSLCCDCVSHIPSDVFNVMTVPERYGLVTIVLGMMNGEEDVNVRIAACRTAGVFVTFPILQQDALFMMDVAMTLKPNVSDQGVGVRSKASWALANMTDALVSTRISNTDLSEVLTDSVLVDLIETALLAARDNDKCRSNGVRALGNLIRISNESFLNRECERKVKDVVNALIKNMTSGAMKTRWNSCHAVANMFSNPSLPSEGAAWIRPLIEALMQAVSSCKNFKVRINAASALASPMSITKYGGVEMVTRVAEVLNAAVRDIDAGETTFGEYRYREQLLTQINATSQHLSELAAREGDQRLRGVLNELWCSM
ncbi:hypothetical protein SmJEL517_g05339 [Synchytrium microbalum]|uniref:DUF4042 domain-containing protein n=1 Tax=Synchytrium microbalum TaxID=1806994 RepID=A0A507BPP8_9FUNG|nr:uncharacterized protein SmJEL517_g05339 [Synchytrium microbalum]TPX31307.1 hypothetical protein SmJEL517_g05339 [Synchytrium microbalum]